jgi:hypothetical protein
MRDSDMRALLVAFATISALSVAMATEQLTIIYLDPGKAPDSNFLIAEWPSYYFMAGAPISVSYSLDARSAVRGLTGYGGGGGGDMDCDQVAGPVYVGENDPNRFDGDGDGWGCER